ncbi:MAG: CDP-alcohol phosphatidyltransferase family protein [Bacillota bacterium]|nr:CDP-alcohol phosphatidyltransferase family protein [Bacillota bacterium]
MIANGVTISRILFSILMLGLPSSSGAFAALYLLCGATDVLDGFLARRLHTESEKGERLDSAADLVFAAVYAVKVLPALQIPLWIWVWTALIAVEKTAGILQRRKGEGRLHIEHSAANKLTGLLIFLLPLISNFADVKYGAAIACATASFAATEELLELKKLKSAE